MCHSGNKLFPENIEKVVRFQIAVQPFPEIVYFYRQYASKYILSIAVRNFI